MNRHQQGWKPHHRSGKGRQSYRNVNDENILHSLSYIVIYPPSVPHGADNRSEIIIEKHHVRGFARYLSAPPAHSNADICIL